MYRHTIITIIFFSVILSSFSIQAAAVSYSDLLQADARRIPYGEVITIHGSITDFDSAGKKYSDWMDLSELSVGYKVGTASGTVGARIGPDRRMWGFDLDALPAKSLLHLELKATLRPSQAGATKVVQQVLEGEKYKTAVSSFFRTAKGATPAKAEDQFLDELGTLLKDAFPAFLSISEVSLRVQPSVRDKLGPLANLQVNFKDLVGALGVTKDMSAAQAYDAVKDKKADKEIDERARSTFVANYKAANEALTKALVETVSQTVTVTHSIPTSSVSTSDLQKYAGIDYAALYVPNAEELRQFIMANIYYGSVDDTPLTFKKADQWYWSSEWYRTRLSLSVGWSIGDLSNNQNSDIDGNNAFALGIGFRLNKYFRLNAGSMQYRSKTDGTLRGDMFYGVSIDVTAFDALKGLVSK